MQSNLEGHLNRINGSRVKVTILLNVWILPIGRASVVVGLLSTMPTRLVLLIFIEILVYIACCNQGRGGKMAVEFLLAVFIGDM